MRKDVKRSLVIWPTIASTAIIGMSYCSISGSEWNLPGRRSAAVSLVSGVWAHANRIFDALDETVTVASGTATVASRTASVASGTAAVASGLSEVVEVQVTSAIGTHREAFERIDHGTRAMKLPERLEFLRESPAGEDYAAAPLPDTEPVQVQPNREESANPPESQTTSTKIGPSLSRYANAYLAKVVPSIDESNESVNDTLQDTDSVSVQDTSAGSVQDTSAGSVSFGEAPPLVGPIEPESKESTKTPDTVTESLQLPTLIPASDGYSERVEAVPDGGQTMPSRRLVDDVDDQPYVANINAPTDAHRSSLYGNPASWPMASALSEQLSALSIVSESAGSTTLVTRRPSEPAGASRMVLAGQWARRVATTLEALQTLNRLGDDRGGELVAELAALADEGLQHAEKLPNRTQRVQWLTTAFAVARRASVWQSVWEVANTPHPSSVVDDRSRRGSHSVESLVAAVHNELDETGDRNGWQNFLLLDELRRAATHHESKARADSATRFLSRLRHPALHPKHVQWIDRSSVSALAEAVRPWTLRAIDYASLLSDIEQQESDSTESSASEIAAAVATLRFAENEKLTNVAQAIETHYRNANLRVAISNEMLTRLLPTMQPRTVPIRTRVMGSRVHGNSRVESDLQLKLNPAPDHWSISLKTLGNVHTRSVGYQGPVAVRTQGRSNFVAATPIEVTGRGIRVGDPTVSVRGKTNLQGIQSKYDQWPLVSRLVRSVAESRYESMAPQSNRIANNMLRSKIADTIDKTLDVRIADATERLRQAVIGPLGRMQLDPQVIDMKTTRQRLLARYRLAGETQLAAFTPRPRAPRQSLMSVQVHQSAINNALEQLIPTGEERTVRQTISDAMAILGADEAPLPEDLPEDVTIQFSKMRPVSVEIEDGHVWVAMRIVRLNKGHKLKLSRFIVRAAYRPEIDGIDVALLRDGHLRISGSGMSMRERLPVRAIFNKVLSPKRKLPLTLPQLTQHQAVKGLSLTQLELRDGWIGLAIGPADAPRLALAAATP